MIFCSFGSKFVEREESTVDTTLPLRLVVVEHRVVEQDRDRRRPACIARIGRQDGSFGGEDCPAQEGLVRRSAVLRVHTIHCSLRILWTSRVKGEETAV